MQPKQTSSDYNIEYTTGLGIEYGGLSCSGPLNCHSPILLFSIKCSMSQTKKFLLSHYEFIKAVALAWIDPDQYWPCCKAKQPKSSPSSNISTISVNTGSAIITRRSVVPLPQREGAVFSDKTLDPCNNSLHCR